MSEPTATPQLLKFKKILFFFTSLFLLSANTYAIQFTLLDVVDQSASYSVTVNGVTMTVDSPHPGLLSNFPDAVEGLDFGQFSGVFELTSFAVSFDADMFVAGYGTSFILSSRPVFDVTGTGVLSLNNSAANLPQVFNDGPLLFLAGERYTFSRQELQDVDAIVFNHIDAQVADVPAPATGWLIGAGLFGVGVVLRRKSELSQ